LAINQDYSIKITIFVFSILIFSTLLSINAYQNVNGRHEVVPIRNGPVEMQRGKFVAYGSGLPYFNSPQANKKIYTEVQGIVLSTDPEGFMVLPDEGYRNLLLPGNYAVPGCSKPPTFRELQIAECGSREDWHKLYQTALALGVPNLPPFEDAVPGSKAFPLIKVEDYTPYDVSLPEKRGPWDPAEIGMFYFWDDRNTGKAMQDQYGNDMKVSVGDHISLKGLYVNEHQHSMWSEGKSCLVSTLAEEKTDFTGLINSIPFLDVGHFTCYGHAEIHPYDMRSFHLLPYTTFAPHCPPCDPVHLQFLRIYAQALKKFHSESHTVAAPVYKAYYPNSALNPFLYKGRLADNFEDKTVKSHFLIASPPHPPECKVQKCSLIVDESIIRQEGNNVGTIQYTKKLQPYGLSVDVTATGKYVHIPAIFAGNWILCWNIGQNKSNSCLQQMQRPTIKFDNLTVDCIPIENDIGNLAKQLNIDRAHLRSLNSQLAVLQNENKTPGQKGSQIEEIRELLLQIRDLDKQINEKQRLLDSKNSQLKQCIATNINSYLHTLYPPAPSIPSNIGSNELGTPTPTPTPGANTTNATNPQPPSPSSRLPSFVEKHRPTEPSIRNGTKISSTQPPSPFQSNKIPTSTSTSTSSPQPGANTTNATNPVMKKNFFIIFKGSTAKSISDKNIKASTSGAFSLIMDSAKLVSGDNIGTVVGSGRVDLKITNIEGCTYAYNGLYKIHGKLTYDAYFTSEYPQGRIRAINDGQPELTTPYEPPSRKDLIFASKVSGPSNCSNGDSSGYSPMLSCSEGAADLDIRLRTSTTKLQRSGENQECTFYLGDNVQRH
jgi:hypothetical protein